MGERILSRWMERYDSGLYNPRNNQRTGRTSFPTLGLLHVARGGALLDVVPMVPDL